MALHAICPGRGLDSPDQPGGGAKQGMGHTIVPLRRAWMVQGSACVVLVVPSAGLAGVVEWARGQGGQTESPAVQGSGRCGTCYNELRRPDADP